MSDYTPTTDEVRDQFALAGWDVLPGDEIAIGRATFDRWLAAERARIEAEVREQVARDIEDDMRRRPLAGHDAIRDAAKIAKGER